MNAFVDELVEVGKVSLTLAQTEFAQSSGIALPKPTAERLTAFLQALGNASPNWRERTSKADLKKKGTIRTSLLSVWANLQTFLDKYTLSDREHALLLNVIEKIATRPEFDVSFSKGTAPEDQERFQTYMKNLSHSRDFALKFLSCHNPPTFETPFYQLNLFKSFARLLTLFYFRIPYFNSNILGIIIDTMDMISYDLHDYEYYKDETVTCEDYRNNAKATSGNDPAARAVHEARVEIKKYGGKQDDQAVAYKLLDAQNFLFFDRASASDTQVEEEYFAWENWFRKDRMFFILFFKEWINHVENIFASHSDHTPIQWYQVDGYGDLIDTYLVFLHTTSKDLPKIVFEHNESLYHTEPLLVNYHMRTILSSKPVTEVLPLMAVLNSVFQLVQDSQDLPPGFDINYFIHFCDTVIRLQHAQTTNKLLQLLFTHVQHFGAELRRIFFLDFLLEKHFFELFCSWNTACRQYFIQLLLVRLLLVENEPAQATTQPSSTGDDAKRDSVHKEGQAAKDATYHYHAPNISTAQSVAAYDFVVREKIGHVRAFVESASFEKDGKQSKVAQTHFLAPTLKVVYARLALDEYQAFTGTVEKWKVKENRKDYAMKLNEPSLERLPEGIVIRPFEGTSVDVDGIDQFLKKSKESASVSTEKSPSANNANSNPAGTATQPHLAANALPSLPTAPNNNSSVIAPEATTTIATPEKSSLEDASNSSPQHISTHRVSAGSGDAPVQSHLEKLAYLNELIVSSESSSNSGNATAATPTSNSANNISSNATDGAREFVVATLNKGASTKRAPYKKKQSRGSEQERPSFELGGERKNSTPSSSQPSSLQSSLNTLPVPSSNSNANTTTTTTESENEATSHVRVARDGNHPSLSNSSTNLDLPALPSLLNAVAKGSESKNSPSSDTDSKNLGSSDSTDQQASPRQRKAPKRRTKTADETESPVDRDRSPGHARHSGKTIELDHTAELQRAASTNASASGKKKMRKSQTVSGGERPRRAGDLRTSKETNNKLAVGEAGSHNDSATSTSASGSPTQPHRSSSQRTRSAKRGERRNDGSKNSESAERTSQDSTVPTSASTTPSMTATTSEKDSATNSATEPNDPNSPFSQLAYASSGDLGVSGRRRLKLKQSGTGSLSHDGPGSPDANGPSFLHIFEGQDVTPNITITPTDASAKCDDATLPKLPEAPTSNHATPTNDAQSPEESEVKVEQAVDADQPPVATAATTGDESNANALTTQPSELPTLPLLPLGEVAHADALHSPGRKARSPRAKKSPRGTKSPRVLSTNAQPHNLVVLQSVNEEEEVTTLDLPVSHPLHPIQKALRSSDSTGSVSSSAEPVAIPKVDLEKAEVERAARDRTTGSSHASGTKSPKSRSPRREKSPRRDEKSPRSKSRPHSRHHDKITDELKAALLTAPIAPSQPNSSPEKSDSNAQPTITVSNHAAGNASTRHVEIDVSDVLDDFTDTQMLSSKRSLSKSVADLLNDTRTISAPSEDAMKVSPSGRSLERKPKFQERPKSLNAATATTNEATNTNAS